MFEDITQFPFVVELEKNWQVIRDEMVAVRNQGFIDWPEKSLLQDGSGWTTFGLYAFGQKQKPNCLLCPRTTALVEAIPGMTMAGFSRLLPGTHIKPHVGYDGYSRYILRLHLGLETNDLCALRVGDETRTLTDGSSIIFNDTLEEQTLIQDYKIAEISILPTNLEMIPTSLLHIKYSDFQQSEIFLS